MTSSDSRTQNTKAADGLEQKSKKPYRTPEFRFERVFETTALACGKVSQTQQQCKFNMKKS
jgi:hypothetical protein